LFGRVYGTLLGDTSITYVNAITGRTPHLAFTHGLVQREWAEHKMAVLHALRWTSRVARNAGFGTWSVQGSSGCRPELVAVHDVVRPDGRRKPKRVNRAWLDRIDAAGRAWWYMDDGSFERRSGACLFHTQGYSRQECGIIAQWLTDLGYRASVHRAGKHHYVRMWKEPSARFQADHQQFAVPSMRYKFGGADHRD
jgi:hypothetical protein